MPDDLKYTPGYHSAEVISYGTEWDDADADKPVLVFQVKIDGFDELAYAEQAAYGSNEKGPKLDKAKAIVASLGGAWEDLNTFDPVGKRCRVGVFHNVKGATTYENVYIVLGGGRRVPMDEETRLKNMAKLTGKAELSDGLPF